MKEIKLTITAQSPLAIGHKKPGSVSEAIDYIPGSAIRGVMAAKLIQQGGQPTTNDDFNKLFLAEDAAIFQNAYPGSNLLPATALSSKAKPGFKPKGNGVFDTLIDRFCAESYGYIFDPNCPQDGGRVEPFSGFYSLDKIGKENKYRKQSVSKRLLTRAGINRRRSTSEEEILYSIEVLNEIIGEDKQPATYYSSIIILDNKLAQSLYKFINNNKEKIRLGGSKSRGLGKVKLETELKEINLDIKQNIEKLNQKLKERWQTWNIFGDADRDKIEERTYFTINLQSDTILLDNWRHTTVISKTMLCQFVDITSKDLIEDLQLEASYSSYDYISGWNSAWGLMKDVELVTNKAGVYLYSIANENKNIWLDKLQKLVTKGVGERTSEGFGQIIICHPFHTIFRENAV